MPSQTVTLTSASTNTSAAVALSWMSGGPTSVSVMGTSISSGAFTLQYTMMDLTTNPSSVVVWSGLSSAIGQIGTVFVASNAYPDGVFTTITSPVAAVRMTSTATNNVNGGPLTMRVLQGETL